MHPRLPLKLLFFSVVLLITFCRFTGMMFGVFLMPMRSLCVVSRLFMLSCVVMFCRLAMVSRGVLVMFSRLSVMFAYFFHANSLRFC